MDSSEPKFLVHTAPAKTAEQNYIARVDLAHFGFPGLFEQMWLGNLGQGVYEVRCIPFRVYGIALGDLVGVSPDGSLINSLIRPSGRRVLRILIIPSLANWRLSVIVDSLNINIEVLNLLFEWSGDRHVAIDIPEGLNVDDLIDLAQGYAERGEVLWEWGDVEPFKAS